VTVRYIQTTPVAYRIVVLCAALNSLAIVYGFHFNSLTYLRPGGLK